MTKILITGARGNVGRTLIDALISHPNFHNLIIFAGVRNAGQEEIDFKKYDIHLIKFDFSDSNTYLQALENCDILFLLRPPEITKVNKYFKPLIAVAKQCKIRHIIFLSVQGVEHNPFIPHYAIEKLVRESGIPYTFLRPAYFMQNFTTILQKDIVNRDIIFLPAGRSKFTLVDVRDIGKVAACVIVNYSNHVNKSYELTNSEKLTFMEMSEKLSYGLGRKITYQSPGLLHFFLIKRKDKMPAMLIFVMIMLHYLPRFKKEPSTSNWIDEIIGQKALLFKEFITDHRQFLISKIVMH